MSTATTTTSETNGNGSTPTLDGDGRDPKTESWLDSLHIEWEYVSALPLDQIDQRDSLANQARLHALDEEVVDRYTADMKRGDRFPPLLALRRPRRKPVLLGGNHRYTAACNTKRPTIAVYVVDAEPEAATRLMYEDNRRHGLPPSEEERVAQAVHLIDTGWMTKAAAECVGVKEHTLISARAAASAERRARSNGVGGFVGLPKSTKARLDGIRSDPVFAEATKLVLAAGMGFGVVQEFVAKLNDCRSEADMMALIGTEEETLRQQIQAKAGGDTTRVRKTPRMRMLSAIGALGGCNPDEVAAGCATRDQAQSMARELDDVRKRIDATLVALRKQWPK